MYKSTKEIWIGDTYYANPDTIKFDTEISCFNPVNNDVEYNATLISIKDNGQVTPIQINSKTGLCEGGRHRTKICKELGIQVLCRKINGDLDSKKRLDIANTNEMSGRDFNNAQKAVMALRYSIKTNTDKKKASAIFKVDNRLVSYAQSINGLGRNDVLDEIIKTGSYRSKKDSASKPSFSLRRIRDIVQAENEEDTVVENTEHTIKYVYDYDKHLNTAKGRLFFWDIYNDLDDVENKHNIALNYIELANFKFVEGE